MKRISILALVLTLSVGATAVQAKTCETHRRNSANRGMAYGAVAGGLIGNAVTKNAAGTLVGAGVGAVAGHEIASNNNRCGGPGDHSRRRYRHHPRHR